MQGLKEEKLRLYIKSIKQQTDVGLEYQLFCPLHLKLLQHPNPLTDCGLRVYNISSIFHLPIPYLYL